MLRNHLGSARYAERRAGVVRLIDRRTLNPSQGSFSGQPFGFNEKPQNNAFALGLKKSGVSIQKLLIRLLRALKIESIKSQNAQQKTPPAAAFGVFNKLN
jgi:hypothetical protein